jgi:hypothetical protein
MEDDPDRSAGVKHAVNDPAEKVQMGIEGGVEAVDERRIGPRGPRLGYPAHRQDSTARRNRCKAAPGSAASRPKR